MTTKNEPNRRRREAALEHYFADLEDRIVEKLHEQATSDQGRSELVRSTGVEDPQLVDELVKLGITADGLVALRLFPLILVAWAEDSADQKERDFVMSEALRLGIAEDSTAWILLDTWMKRRPPGLGVDAWKRYVHDTFAKMSKVAAHRLIDLTEKQMINVAKASGGHLGFGKISKKEKLMIDRLTTTMKQAAAI